MSTERTLDRIAQAFAEAVAAEDFDKAEGWLAVARFVRRTSDAREAAIAVST